MVGLRRVGVEAAGFNLLRAGMTAMGRRRKRKRKRKRKRRAESGRRFEGFWVLCLVRRHVEEAGESAMGG